MAKLTIKKDEKDPIVELLNQQAIEDFKAKRQQFQQTLPKRQLKQLQQEVTQAYLKGYEEARQRCDFDLSATSDEIRRLRYALELAIEMVEDTDKALIIKALRSK